MNGHVGMTRAIFQVGRDVVQRIPPLLPRAGLVGSEDYKIHLILPKLSCCTSYKSSVQRATLLHRVKFDPGAIFVPMKERFGTRAPQTLSIDRLQPIADRGYDADRVYGQAGQWQESSCRFSQMTSVSTPIRVMCPDRHQHLDKNSH